MDIQWDNDGTAVNAYGEKMYKRWAWFMLDGVKRIGAVLISQSDDQQIVVNLAELVEDVKDNSIEVQTWKPLNQFLNVPMGDVIKVFDVHTRRRLETSDEWTYADIFWRTQVKF